ncbi:sulfotransferase [Strigomonas culicis]|uniref:Sulfotransferase n=1 Tax=Strigomonas culicis TaxID=28005 RepID=S9U2P7_9TRYP|nr:sulfotransferase [Strigomonas culicis]EPY25052.1 sulfotransferase [Strigomonas culicis]|eukprot:EPY20255.1 sulfotransferase [Strigomonas culicis]
MVGRIKAMSGVRDLVRGGNLAARAANLLTRRPTAESFLMENVLKDSCHIANVEIPSEPDKTIEHYRWWNKLCRACGEKNMTAYGAARLRSRLINALSQRLAIDELYRLNGNEIERERIEEPLVVMGLPRSNGHFAAHVLSHTGLFLAAKQCDTLTPSMLHESDRVDRFRRQFFGFPYLHPDFLCVRVPQATQIDDDLTLHLLTPQSLAWGLLHGLDTHLLECIEEDQTPVYAQLKRTLKLLQWYHRCGHLTTPVAKEYEPIENPMETQKYGTKPAVARAQWVLHSPLAILSTDALNETFPDLRAIWVHRALAQCIPSLCSSLCLHNALYTGKPPTDAQLALTGEKVLGLFGSGTQYAIDYYGGFDQKRRMVHWSNRDVKRHASRLAGKTLAHFGIDLDRYRRMQMINGQTAYGENARPLHDSQMPYFALHEGLIGDVFKDYIYQFEEFAFEKRFGVHIQEYESIAGSSDNVNMGALRIGSSDHGKLGSLEKTTLGAGHTPAGHFLKESDAYKS